MTSSTQTRASAHYASTDTDWVSASTAGSTAGRHRASQAEAIKLELVQLQARLAKLRHRMRAAVGTSTVLSLGLACAVLIALAVLSLMSFVGGDGGLGMLLGGAFIAGMPLIAAAAIRASQPWWRLGHEAALLRQRETELHALWDRTVAGSVASESAASPGSVPSQQTSAGDSGDETEWFWRAASADSAASPAASPGATTSSRATSSASVEGASDADALHLAEYGALSPSSHVLARALHDTLGARSTDAPTPEVANSQRSYQLLDAAVPHQPKRWRTTARTEPSWWSPTGLNERAMQHATPADPTPTSVGGWGVLLAVGALMTLFALGIIAGVLSSA
ncbi:MAG: hypothetical protein ACRDPW_07380 [Mycobacteriales bacterium]